MPQNWSTAEVPHNAPEVFVFVGYGLSDCNVPPFTSPPVPTHLKTWMNAVDPPLEKSLRMRTSPTLCFAGTGVVPPRGSGITKVPLAAFCEILFWKNQK